MNIDTAGNEVYKLSSEGKKLRFPLEFTVHTDLDTAYQFIEYCCEGDPSHKVYPVTTSLTLKIKRCHPKNPNCSGHLVGYVHFAPLPHDRTLIKFTEDIANNWCKPAPPLAFVPIVEYLLARLMEHGFIDDDFAIEDKPTSAFVPIADDRQAVQRAMAMARRALFILEEQAAGFGKLHIPIHLQIELEEKRREVAELEAQLRALEA